MKPYRLKSSHLFFASAIATLLATPSASAVIWLGASNGNWGNGANWTGGSVPGANSLIEFQSTTGNAAPYISAARTVSGIRFLSGNTVVQNIKLSTQPNASGTAVNLTFNSTNTGIIVNDGATHIIGAPTAVGAHGDIVLLGNLPIATTSGNLTINRPITDGASSFGVTKTGSGTLLLSGTNTYDGPTTITDGTLSVGLAANLGSAASNLVFDGGTLRVTGTTLTNITSLGRTNPVVLTAGKTVGLEIADSSNTFTVGQVLNQTTGGFTKLGTGKAILDQTNTYTGATAVNAGVLAVNGSLANTTTTVGNTATLQGSGTIAGSVTIQSGGILAAGNSIESLGTGALSFESGSTLAYEFQTNLYGSTPNESADLTDSTGTLDITAGALLTLNDLATSTALALGSKFTLISYFGGWTSTELFTYNAATLNDGATFTIGANTWEFNYDDLTGGPNYSSEQATGINARFVTMTVVPEPRAALLGGLGLLALLRRRRH